MKNPLTRAVLLIALLSTQWSVAMAEGAEGFINAPLAEVWRVFTTADGYRTLGPAQADVDLKLGGLIRSHDRAEGQLGDAGTTIREILSFEPERMLSTRVVQSPLEATRGVWTVTYFSKSGEDMTYVKIVELGYGGDAASSVARARAEQTHKALLDQLTRRYAPKCKLCEKEASGT